MQPLMKADGTRRTGLVWIFWGLIGVLISRAALCGLTDLATAPLITSSSTSVLPNLMFVMDDSGSMSWTHMPDTVASFSGTSNDGTCTLNPTNGTCKFGYRSSQCNGVYYDPTITYTPPVDSTGASYPNANFTAAWKNGFNQGLGTVNLSTGFYAYGDGGSRVPDNTTNGASISGYDNPQPAYYYRYSGYQVTANQQNYNDTNGVFYRECNSLVSSSTKVDGTHPVKNLFTQVVVGVNSGPGGTDERQNFANWFSYYRIRMLMMKTSVGMAFNPVDSRYRVAFMTINNNVSPGFVPWAPFNSAQKSVWYAKLYASSPSNSTPVREALANVGRMYAAKLTSINNATVTDPVQYSCQQNFSILSTDGYWNGTDSSVRNLAGGTVANTDSNISTTPRPYFDGGINYSPTLADVAQYYYSTDLRSTSLNNCTGSLGNGIDVCTDNVPSTALDTAMTQHMTTFTLGLGAPGRMVFSPSYQSDTSGDYFDVKQGTLANPGAGICSWQTSGTCNWPKPVADKPEAIDDLWHAAVNGRGTYFSATNASSLAVGLSEALAGVSARSGSSAGAAISNPNMTSDDNFVISSAFRSVDWTGDVYQRVMDPGTGTISNQAIWSAQELLDRQVGRVLYTGSASGLKPFVWDNLTSVEQGYFSLNYIQSNLTQFCTIGPYCLSASDQAAAAGPSLVRYLAGDRSHEGSLADNSKYFRMRAHLLGDVVNSTVAYVKKALFAYTDPGYMDFITSSPVTTRSGMAYVGANDGMVHAFGTEGARAGQELWAYIPSFILPDLHKLADKSYGSRHQFYVDGSPVARDVQFGGAWHTILVGGMNRGGRGYYALDITDPEAPRSLWEFTNDNLGYTYGNPVIVKLTTGQWVVMVASGYNNVAPGDGVGRLYILDAGTGALLRTLTTGAGSVTSPSGLAKISPWIENAKYDATALRVYGGDLLGNVWRFDINGNVGGAGYDAHLLATLKDATGVPQPITTKPELGELSNHALVYVGTGALLGVSDLTNTHSQSLYAIKDPLDTTRYGDPRTDPSHFVRQLLLAGLCPAGSPPAVCATGENVRTISATQAVDLSTQSGWYIDFPATGERMNDDPLLALGMITFVTNVPSASACTMGGTSYRYFLDARTGGFVSSVSTHVVAQSLGNALGSSPVMTQLSNGSVNELIQLSNGQAPQVREMPVPPIGSLTRRVLWRELPTE